MVEQYPYIDLKGGIRIFKYYVAEEDLVWHRDKEDREVAVMKGKGWKFQFDNELPFLLPRGKLFKIPKMQYHRIIKGEGDLVLKIWSA